MQHSIDVKSSEYNARANVQKTFVSLKTTEKDPVQKRDSVIFREKDKEGKLTGRGAEFRILHVEENIPGFRLKGKTKYVVCSLFFLQLSM